MATFERFGPGGHDLVYFDESRPLLSLGKSDSNDLVIDDDPSVSRVHAHLELWGTAWRITDRGSTNGTVVNGERLMTPRMLSDRDEILIGRTRLVLRDVGTRARSASTPPPPTPKCTPNERRLLVELCRPLLPGKSFAKPASIAEIADALAIRDSAVEQQLARVSEKFRIEGTDQTSRHLRLANEAIEIGAITANDVEAPSEA